MQCAGGVNIVVYHYVRPLAFTRYPAIKARQLEDFDKQLDHLQSNYQILPMSDFLDACSQHDVPDRTALLTFDDGFLDHFTYVFPRLVDRGITGAFYPASAPVLDGTLLDVHRVHFILAAAGSVENVTVEMESLMRESMPQDAIANLRAEWKQPKGYDAGDVIYIKRALQVALPRQERSDLSARLFRKFVSTDERAFAEELYMNSAQLRLMHNMGMHIGSHAHSHEWLSKLGPPEQAEEIDLSLGMLSGIGVDVTRGWTIAFPYGDRSAVTCELIRAKGCSAAFTTEHRIADPELDDMLDLPRIDTVAIFP